MQDLNHQTKLSKIINNDDLDILRHLQRQSLVFMKCLIKLLI
jgi:hypothetical protein